jgi:two-component system NarL family sensor kinase
LTRMPPRSQLLSKIVAIAAEERSFREVLRRSAALVVQATGSDACFLHVVDPERSEVVLMGAHPEEFDALAGSIRLPIGQGVAGWVALHGEIAVVDDKWSDPRYRYIPELKGENYRSLVSAPLLRPGRSPVGVVNVHSHDPQHFTSDLVGRLAEVADLLAGIVEAAVLHEQLRQREEQLERFTEQMIEMQEADRRRIASDIHDGISQRLVSAWYHLGAARSQLLAARTVGGDGRPDEAGSGAMGALGPGSLPTVLAEIDAVEELLRDALDEARGAITGLRPTVLDDLGLAAAIGSLARSAGGFELELDLQPCEAASHLEMCVYRVAQEAVQNAVRHSSASVLHVALRCEEEMMVLEVADNGRGFDRAAGRRAGSCGLDGMSERAALVGGSLEVRSAPGRGTHVRLAVPLEGNGCRLGSGPAVHFG